MDISNFVPLCKVLNQEITFDDPGPPDIPFDDPFDAGVLVQLVQDSANRLPLDYQQQYAQPLADNLPGLIQRIWAELQQENPTASPAQLKQAATDFFEPIVGAVYDQSVAEVRPQLNRFLAVISDLYRSFLSKSQRAQADVPLVEQLPPLATFAHLGKDGPFTIPSDDTLHNFGAKIGVVSLPSSYRDHPLIWAALAHETGGHDVLHADVKLLPELRAGIQQLFANNQFLGQLWAYWMDEAAADIYGLLNIGPAFVFNLAAFFTTLVEQLSSGRTTLGVLGNRSFLDGQNQLDVHPTDILRVHLALGAIETQRGLSLQRKSDYVTAVEALAQQCAGGANTIQFVATEGGRTRVVQEFPLADMQTAARQAGTFIATAQLDALVGHTIQDIETWDDADDFTAVSIATQFINNGSVSGMGDDAQLLSGATLALLQDPELYERVTGRLNEGLDESFARDPIFRLAHAHRIFFRPELFKRISFDQQVGQPVLGLGAPAKRGKQARRRSAARA